MLRLYQYEVTIFIDHYRFIQPWNSPGTALEKIATARVAAVRGLGINTIELAHPFGQIDAQGFENKVVMIAHQVITAIRPVVVSNYLAKDA